MAVITLISDYGWKDPYTAALKGHLLSEIESCTLVDITHSIPPFNLRETAHVLNNSYHHFPKNTIHLLCVDEELREGRKVMAMFFDDHFFIGLDNGLFGLIIQERKDFEMVDVDTVLLEDAKTSREKFTIIAGHLHRGGKLSMLGKKTTVFNQFKIPKATLSNNDSTIIGIVMYIDHFGNAVTNVTRNLFEDVAKGRSFEIIIPLVRKAITKVLKGYGEANNSGSSIAVFNSNGLLEIAIYKPGGQFNNGAHTLLGLSLDDAITIKFK
jgi:S-adenosylmethionine hydrolase